MKKTRKLNKYFEYLFVKVFGLNKTKVILKSENAVTVINFSFGFIALLLAVLLTIGIYKFKNKVLPTNEAIINMKAANLHYYHSNNTVLKTKYATHIAVQTILQTNPYIMRGNTHSLFADYMDNAKRGEEISKEAMKEVCNNIANKEYVQLFPNRYEEGEFKYFEECSYLKTYVRLEYFKSKVTSIEEVFFKATSNYVDSLGDPILEQYSNQVEYDSVTTKWLTAIDRLIDTHDLKLQEINTVLKVLSMAHIEYVAKGYVPTEKALALKNYRNVMFPELIRQSNRRAAVIGGNLALFE